MNTAMRQQRDSRGFTLMEMLVTVAVLALMVGAFGAILTEAQDLVVTSQAIMKANARATSLAGIIREDISRASKLGFLHIEHRTFGSNRADRLFIAIPGACKSVTSWPTGTGSILAYGQKNDCIYRASYVFAGKNAADLPSPIPDDVFFYKGKSPDFTLLQTSSTDSPNQFDGNDDDPDIDFILRMQDETDALDLSAADGAASLSEVNDLWPLLSRHCTQFRIVALKKDLDVVGHHPASGSTDSNLDGSGTWTKADADWPKAIRITMTLTDPEILDRAGATSTFTYEIICPVRP